MYPTVEEREAIVSWVPGIVRDVNFGKGWISGGSTIRTFGVELHHEEPEDIRFYGRTSMHDFFSNDGKRQYLAAKNIQKGDHVKVGLNEIGILMDVEKI